MACVRSISFAVITAITALALGAPAFAQEKPTVSKYLAEGYQLVHTEIGNPFIQLILRKENILVWCSVLLQSGETSSCRTLK
jgi:hypothetical protein